MFWKVCDRMKNNLYKKAADLPVIETKRLILRKISPYDAADMYEYAHLPEVTQYLTWREHPSVDHTLEYLKILKKAYKKGEYFDWALELKESGKMIGTCGFAALDFYNLKGEIGYVLNPVYSKRGLMTEAVKKVIEYGFGTLGLERIEAKHLPGNENRASVMRR